VGRGHGSVCEKKETKTCVCRTYCCFRYLIILYVARPLSRGKKNESTRASQPRVPRSNNSLRVFGLVVGVRRDEHDDGEHGEERLHSDEVGGQVVVDFGFDGARVGTWMVYSEGAVLTGSSAV
jgi:hypothetical protein